MPALLLGQLVDGLLEHGRQVFTAYGSHPATPQRIQRELRRPPQRPQSRVHGVGELQLGQYPRRRPPLVRADEAGTGSCGPLVKRYGARSVLITGNVLAAVGYLATIPVVGSDAYVRMAVQFVVAGFGIGLVVPSMTNAMLGSVDPANAGIASGVLNASRQLGGLIGVAVMGLLVGQASSGHFLTGLRASLIAAVVALAVSAGLSTFGPRKPRPVLAPVADDLQPADTH
ncbi:MFS transporter [Streptomyces cellulosae]